MERITHEGVKDLGFERHEGNDPVWFREHGYKYFWMQKTLSKTLIPKGKNKWLKIIAEWSPDTKEARILNCEDGHIRSRVSTHSLRQLTRWVNFYE